MPTGLIRNLGYLGRVPVAIGIGLALSFFAGRAMAQAEDAGAPGADAGAAGADAATPPSSTTPPKTNPPPAADTLESGALLDRIKNAKDLADALITRVWALKGRGSLSQARAQQQEDQINAWAILLKSFRDRAATYAAQNKATQEEKKAVLHDEAALAAEVAAAEKALAATHQELTTLEKSTGWNLIGTLLAARCATAICFDNGDTKNWLGIEPLVELPIGKSFAVGHTSLSDWVNNHDLRVDLAAGVRVWFFRDIISLSLYISKPLSDAPVRLKGSPFVYPGASIRRAYPGAALGMFFDSIWIGFDRDELRNGDGQDSHDMASGALNSFYPPNEVISSAWTVTLALQPVTAFRTAIGTAVQSSKGSSK